MYLEGGVDELYFLDRGATSEEIAAYFLAATQELDARIAHVCDPQTDAWGCDCPTSLDLDCDTLTVQNGVDLADPTTINRTGWLTTTYDSGTDHWYVELDATAIPGGVAIAPPNEGVWGDVTEMMEYLEDLLGVPYDSNTEKLESFSYTQSGTLPIYFVQAGKLVASRDALTDLLTDPMGGGLTLDQEVLIRGATPNCPARPDEQQSAYDPVIHQDLCEYSGNPENVCIREKFEGEALDSVRGRSVVDLKLWTDPVATVSSCVDHYAESRSTILTGSNLETSASGTNAVDCLDPLQNQDFHCEIRPVYEVIEPVPPSHPQYVSQLKIRAIKRLSEIELDAWFYTRGQEVTGDVVEHRKQDADFIFHRDTKSGIPFVRNASCSIVEMTRGMNSITIENGVGDEGGPWTLPACAAP